MNTRLRLTALFIALCLPGHEAFAADETGWELVMRDRARKIELDRSSIVDAPDEVRIAWARVVLSPAETRQAGYAIIKALNRFDCRNRRFTTVRRLYLDAELRALREEVIRNPAAVEAQSGVDERLWREVCRPPNVAELAQVAKAAEEAMAEVASPASPAEPAPSPTPPRPATPSSPRPAAPAPVAPPPAVAPAPVPARPGAASSGPATAQRPATPPAPAPQAAPSAPARTASSAAERTPARPAGSAPPAAPPRAASAPAAASAAAATPVPSSRPPLNLPPARPFVTTEPIVVPERPPRPPLPSVYTGGVEPPMWGFVRPEWRLCARGQAQSPIDLVDALPVGLDEPTFDYRPSYFRIENTGHTLMIRPGEGNHLQLRGERYELMRIELREPAEARIEGRVYEMSVHLLHQSPTGQLAEVVVPLMAGGLPNAALQTIFNNLPLNIGRDFSARTPLALSSFVPPRLGYYLYLGSLTTPPCTEGVVRVVMREPLTISREQLAIFKRLHPGNARPLQNNGGRVVLRSQS